MMGDYNVLEFRYRVLLDAAKNLIKVKGRYHTEIAYKRLEQVYEDIIAAERLDNV